ncbi:amino acid permease [Pseudoclavibacter sp. CFCC 13796]|uniref:amino acid permease n=1 Tax=Pseudoclavibacter sp. CFCC 13796 TaxID=2615179 RepID=UPI001300CCAB|nr:amino acid permease [Pseudoclavibacter sp. CFCC 13796]KAB1661074.1 amino acid permease [Pseudoclavibacter sp. CFCC 13796]
MSLFARKTITQVNEDLADPERQLKRELTAWDIAVMGVAVAVGAGIFSVGAQAAANYAGPAVIISFVIAAAICGLAVMNYAEFASTVPVSGSAYTFSYLTMGELIAWIIGWDLILEMLMAASVISKYWGIYVRNVFEFVGWHIPTDVQIGPFTASWPPIVIVAIFTTLLVLGTKLTTRVNNIFTVIKVGITIFIVLAGAFYVKAANFVPFLPPSEPTAGGSGAADVMHQSLFSFMIGADPTRYGAYGLLGAAALVFFAFIGFDIVATTAEETKDPQRNLPRGIFGGLGLVSLLYIAVTIVVTGMVSFREMAEQPEPSLATAFQIVGANWVGTFITIGILVGLTTVIMVLLLGLARIVFAMSRDGLLPRAISHTSKRGTPARLQIGCGVVVAVIASLGDVNELSEMINIGTLSAFVLVSFAVPVLRRRYPDVPRGFRVPWSPALPIISGVLCIWLMTNLAVETWLRFVVWLLVGLAFYFGYSYKNSRVRLEGGLGSLRRTEEADDADRTLAAAGATGEAGATGTSPAGKTSSTALTATGTVFIWIAAVLVLATVVGLFAGMLSAAGLNGAFVWVLMLAAIPGLVVSHVALHRAERIHDARVASAAACSDGTLAQQHVHVASGASRALLTSLCIGYSTAAVAVVVGIVHIVAVLS